MMKEKNFLCSIGIIATCAMALVGCNKANKSNNEDSSKEASKFPNALPKKETKQGGLLELPLKQVRPLQEYLLMS